MKLLLYSWNANNEKVLADNLINQGFEVIWFSKACKHYTRDMELAMEMIPFIHARKVDAVISFNYFPIVSMICNTCRIPYYAWVYDCPHFTLYAKQITLPCNHIGIFDREMARHLEDYGVGTVYHVPLSADTVHFERIIAQASGREKEKYRCDISFVGSMYTGEHNYYDEIFSGNGAEQADIGAAVARQCFSYHDDCLRRKVTDGDLDLHVLQARMEDQGLMLGEDYFSKPEDILMAAVLEKKVTVEERRILLTKIVECFACNFEDKKRTDRQNASATNRHGDANHKYDFRLYTGSDTKGLLALNIHNHGMVDYHTQMPLVFAGSRINLNISLRSIHSGIPLRVLDIMACGGFVLSNWQPEIADYFEEGEEIVTFDSVEDCLEKIAYYLTHEEERSRIARNGRRKVQKEFSYKTGLERLFR